MITFPLRLVKNQERSVIFIIVLGTYPGVTGRYIHGREMNDERGILYLSFVLASIISDSDIYSDPRSHIKYITRNTTLML